MWLAVIYISIAISVFKMEIAKINILTKISGGAVLAIIKIFFIEREGRIMEIYFEHNRFISLYLSCFIYNF